MRTKLSILAAAVAALATLAFAPAGGEVCYDLDVNVNGDQLVDEEGCEEVPEPPTAPELP